MPIISNFGTINYTVGQETGALSSNIVTTDLNVSYSSEMLKSASPDEFAPGDSLVMQVRIDNTGTGTLYNPVISEDLGGAVDYLEYVAGSAHAFLYDTNGDVVPLNVTETVTAGSVSFAIGGAVSGGDTLILTYETIADSGISAAVLSITSLSGLVAREGGAGGVVHTNSASVTIDRSDITIVKSASSTSVTPGDSLSYTFTLTNVGAQEVTVNSLSDNLPANFVVGSTIEAAIGSTDVVYDRDTDFTVDDNNLLTISPDAASTPLTVPAASGGNAGVTVITITGTISA